MVRYDEVRDEQGREEAFGRKRRSPEDVFASRSSERERGKGRERIAVELRL